jgi:hypothetical protein
LASLGEVKAAPALALLALSLVPGTAAAAFPGTGLQRLSGAPSRNPAISQDKRFGRLAAFEADTGGTTNVFVVRRAGGYGENGTRWHAGASVLASRGLGGQPANGPSTQPSLDGTSRVAPHCVAFVSAASNLVRGDTNGKPDAFLDGRRAPGRRGQPLDRLHPQRHHARGHVCLGRPQPLVARRQRRHGRLPARDDPPLRGKGSRPAGARLHMDTRLVSARPDGRAGAAASHSPASNVDGTVVAFVTTAADLVGRATRGISQVVKAHIGGGRPRLRLASRASRGRPGNGPSTAPTLTAGGTWVMFESDATDVALTTARRPDVNGVRDAMLSTEPSGERWLLGERGASGPTTNPMTSPHGNYVVFERGGHAYLLYVGPK